MSGDSRRRPSAALVVAIIALVVALTGTALAGPVATMAKKLIDGSSIKKHSIPANRLANHSITAQQVNAAKLGFLASSKIVRWNFAMNKGGASHKVAIGPLTLTATCTADGANTDAQVAATTSESNTFVTSEPEDLPGIGTTISPGNPPYPIVSQDTAVANDGNSGGLAAFDGRGKLAVFSTAQTIGVAINTPGANCRFFGYVINDA